MKRAYGMAMAVALGSVALVAQTVSSSAQGSWTGPYAGIHVGHGWGNSQTTVLDNLSSIFPQGTVFPTTHSTGFLGGGQIGYNYQMGQFVLGLEADLSGTQISSTSVNFGTVNTLNDRPSVAKAHTQWMATAAARLGIAQGSFLYYAKGGFAWAETNGHAYTRNSANSFLFTETSSTTNREGWLVGGGLEYMMSRNWTLKAEYNYIDFGKAMVKNNVVGSFGTTTFPTGTVLLRSSESEQHSVKLGLNYKF
jgi:outer membrane immunogenic protein